MKRLFAIFLVLGFVGYVHAVTIDTLEGEELTDAATIEGVSTTDMIEGQDIKAAAAGDHCSACPDAGAGADVGCEDWEDTGSICTWSAYDPGNGAYDEDASHSGSWGCTDKGSECLEITISTDNYMWYYFDHGSETTEVYAQIYLKVTSESLGDDDVVRIGSITDAGSNDMLQWRLTQESGQLKLYYAYVNGSAAWADSSKVNISTDTQYRVRFSWVDGSPGTYNAWIDTTQVITNETAHTDREFRKFWLGQQDESSEPAAATIEYDNLRIDDDTMPGACS